MHEGSDAQPQNVSTTDARIRPLPLSATLHERTMCVREILQAVESGHRGVLLLCWCRSALLDLQGKEDELPQGGADRDDDDRPHDAFSDELGGAQNAVDHHADAETMAHELVHGCPTLSNSTEQATEARR